MRHVQGGGELHAYRHRGRNKNNSQGNIFLLLFLAASRVGGKDLAINCLQETRVPDLLSLGLQHPTKLSPPAGPHWESRKGCSPPRLPLGTPGLRSAPLSRAIASNSRCPPSSRVHGANSEHLKSKGKPPHPGAARQGLPWTLPFACSDLSRPPPPPPPPATVCFGKPGASPCLQSPVAPGQAEQEGKPEAWGREGACGERRTGREMEK